MKLWFEQVILPKNARLAGLLGKSKKIHVVYIPQEDELGADPFNKGHYRWKPF